MPGQTLTPIVLSGPTEAKVEGELWLLYSVEIQSAERAEFEKRNSSMAP